MDILYCNRPGNALSGNTVHINEVIKGLSGLGHNIILLGGKLSDRKPESDPESQTPTWRRIETRILNWSVFRPFRGELSLLGIFGHEVYVFITALVVIIKNKRRLGVIYRRHTVINSEYLLSKIFRIPLIKEVNGIVTDEMRCSKVGSRISLGLVEKIERLNMSKASRIITVTFKLKDLLSLEYGVESKKIVVIQNGANTTLFRPMDMAKTKKEIGLDLNIEYVCFVGSLFYWQGVQNLIKSTPLVLEKYPDTKILIVGDGPMKKELSELARQTGIMDKVIFTGAVSYEEVPLYINASDVCVAPKVPLEGGYSPIKLYEYMACSRPVIATRTDGFEILEENDAGLLVNPDDSKKFADAIIQFLVDKELGTKMGVNGRNYVLKNHSWENIAHKVSDVCQQALQKHNE